MTATLHRPPSRRRNPEESEVIALAWVTPNGFNIAVDRSAAGEGPIAIHSPNGRRIEALSEVEVALRHEGWAPAESDRFEWRSPDAGSDWIAYVADVRRV